MKVLVINSGSSSIKYQLFRMPEQEIICSGLIERIGLSDGIVNYTSEIETIKETIEIPNHKVGLEKVVNLLLDKKIGVLTSTNEVAVVGHRVVHGGNSFTETTIITEEVKNKIKDLFSLAPQHNPANLEGINVAEEIFKNAKQVAVFDTAFHQSIPEKAYTYAIPRKFLTEEQIRLYGFHGTSHKYVSEIATTYLGKENTKVITIHLGNGCSITAVENGKSMDHSLGFGPVTGLVMGTRSGDIDHTLIFYLVNTLGYDVNDVNTLLQKESGMFGLTGYSDLRDIEAAALEGNITCQLALDINAYRVQKYIGSYVAVMNGLDAIVFTAGIGENSILMREKICSNMDYFGIKINAEKNNIRVKELTEIHIENAKVKVLVIPTNEELEIAKQAYNL